MSTLVQLRRRTGCTLWRSATSAPGYTSHHCPGETGGAALGAREGRVISRRWENAPASNVESQSLATANQDVTFKVELWIQWGRLAAAAVALASVYLLGVLGERIAAAVLLGLLLFGYFSLPLVLLYSERRPLTPWLRWAFLAGDALLLGILAVADPDPGRVWFLGWPLLAVIYVPLLRQAGGWFIAAATAACAVYVRVAGGEGDPLGAVFTAVVVAVIAFVLDRVVRVEKEARAAFHKLAIRDGLTGLYNRRFFSEMLRREMARARREGTPLSLLLIDIDYFKVFNDRYGHAAGDSILEDVAKLLISWVRVHDSVFRFGGEEFAILLPNADAHMVKRVAARLHRVIRRHPFPYGPVTISVGWSTYTPGDAPMSEDELVQRADQVLYQAKEQGRDRVGGVDDAADEV